MVPNTEVRFASLISGGFTTMAVINQTERKMEKLELVSKELNHLAAILHVYAGGLNFMK